MKTIIMNVKTSEKRVAVIEGNKVLELNIQQPKHKEIVGNIYKGRVIDVLPGMQAAFVDIGLGRNGYIGREQLATYHLSPPSEKEKSISHFIRQGEEIIVQVTKEGAERKGPKLTGLIEFPGASLVYLPFGNYVAVSRKMKEEEERNRWRKFGQTYLQNQEGLIIRTACENQDETKILKELEFGRSRFKVLQDQQKKLKPPSLLFDANNLADKILLENRLENIKGIVIDDAQTFRELKEQLGEEKVSFFRGKENIFSFYGIEKEIERGLKQIVWIDNGAYLLIEQTEALTIIDVNTGKFQGKENLQDTVFKTNLAAAKEIANQLILRDISGIILIDFIDMKLDVERQKVIHALRSVAKEDRNRVTIHGFTSLGILEMTRKKTRNDLSAILQTNCPTCSGTGRIDSAETVVFKLERELWEHQGMDHDAVWIEATDEVKHVFLGAHNEHKKRLEDALSIKIYITELASAKHDYTIRQLGSNDEIKARLHIQS
ncbi:Rne/Rng family ribonuclease [Bacillus sp. JJ1521]|uniref:Rne/Rng family ribonuclease n=1 Tax=Bacillus sp. JJ1521 TaxID=3122957 RepID=UPI002FFDCF0D